MQEIKGYYDGESSVIVNKADLEKLGAKPNQMLTIIVQDNYLKEKESDEAEKRRRIEAVKKLGGSCKGLFEGINPDEYVRKLRAEWDEREACHE